MVCFILKLINMRYVLIFPQFERIGQAWGEWSGVQRFLTIGKAVRGNA